MPNIQALAKFYREQMEQSERTNGDKYWKFKEHTSAIGKRCNALSQAAHDNCRISPDDWRYSFLWEALNALEECSDPDDVTLEPDIYTSQLTAWLDSRADRLAYCDEAIEDGLIAESANMFDRLQTGQYLEKQEVLHAVHSHLQNELDASEEDNDD